MTVKEIALSVGKDERSIQRWIQKTADKMSSINDKMSLSSPVNPADYTTEETLLIIESGTGKNAAGIWRANHEMSVAPQVNNDRLDRLENMVEKLLTIMVNQIQLAQQKQIEPDRNYFTILGYSQKIGMKLTSGEMIALGKEATKISVEKGYEKRTIDGDHYPVGSYHTDVLKQVLGV